MMLLAKLPWTLGSTLALEHLSTGVSLLTAGRPLRAAVWMRRSLRVDLTEDPEALGAMNAVGEVLMEQGSLGAAEACWLCSLETDALQVGVYERLAFTLRLAGRLPEAAEALREALDMPTLDDDDDRAWMWLDLGALLEDIAPVPGAGPEVLLDASAPAAVQPVHVGEEDLTAEACYRHAVELAPSNGEAHKRLADLIVQAHGAHAAQTHYEAASQLMPHDICAATHSFYGADTAAHRHALPPLPLAAAAAAPPSLTEITRQPPPEGVDERSAWGDAAARHFERYGVLVLPGMLSEAQLAALCDSIGADADEGSGGEGDFTPETREAGCRVHRALAIDESPAVETALSEVMQQLHPLLARALHAAADADNNDDLAIPLLGSGYMSVGSGARAQELHKDVHGHDRFDAAALGAVGTGGGPRAISIQLQLTDTSSGEEGSLGSLEVLPGSHRPDATGSEAAIQRALTPEGAAEKVVPVNVEAGTVTLYSSRLWHRGGANEPTAQRERVFAYVTVCEPGVPAAPGLIHSMARRDVGQWVVRPAGLKKKRA